MPAVSSVNFYGRSIIPIVDGVFSYDRNQTKLINTDFYYEVSNSPTFNTDPFNPLIRLPFYLCALEKYMQYCLGLASRGSGFVAPNPMVGALVVAEGRIIGEGWHQEFGGAHAEVNALNNVKPENVICFRKLLCSLHSSHVTILEKHLHAPKKL